MGEQKGLKSFRAESWVGSDPTKPQMHGCPLSGQRYGAEPAGVKSSMLLQRWGASTLQEVPTLPGPGLPACLKKSRDNGSNG